jgi:hypothetical protein
LRLKEEAMAMVNTKEVSVVRADLNASDDAPWSYTYRALNSTCAGARRIEYAHSAVFGPQMTMIARQYAVVVEPGLL